jgi:membrane protein DedA with SNARE-associated domain/rhodanese-related sulfurtransferase
MKLAAEKKWYLLAVFPCAQPMFHFASGRAAGSGKHALALRICRAGVRALCLSLRNPDQNAGMDLAPLIDALQRNAVWVVFANVFLQQVGLPIPAVPTLMVAGSLAGLSGQAAELLAAAVLASVIADWLWYRAGRAFGYRILTGLCRLSLNPGSCVSETETRFMRWGVWSLVVAKFIPGFSTVAPPIAGSLRMPLPSFVAAAAAGAALWAGAAILAGWVLRDQLRFALDLMSRHAILVGAAIALAFGLWLAGKLWQKYRFERLAKIPHISPAQLMEALQSEAPPLLLDFRGPALVAQTGQLAGATQADLHDLAQALGDWPKDHRIVTLCACPEDATAVQAARDLAKMGYTAVRPLQGGYDAWVEHLQKQGDEPIAVPHP